MLAELARKEWSIYSLSWINASYLPESLTYLNQPRALLMSKVVSVGCLLTQDNYWLTSTYLTILSFAGIWYLVQTLRELFPTTRSAVVVAWFGYPSFVFWSSGILKETIAVGLVSTVVAGAMRYDYRSEQKMLRILIYGLGWLIATYLLWIMKYYYAAVLAPILLAILAAKKTNFFQNYLIAKAAAVFLILGLITTSLHPNLHLARFVDVIVKNHDAFLRISSPTNVIHFYELDTTLTSLLMNTPLALFSSWYRPLLLETNSWIQHLAGLENVLLLILSVTALWKLREVNSIGKNEKLWVVGGLAYAILLGVLLAFSTPNFGTLIRYKVAFSPFVLYLIMIPILKKSGARHINRDRG